MGNVTKSLLIYQIYLNFVTVGVAGQNIQFASQQTPINVSCAQTMPSSQLIAVSSQQQQQLMSTTIPTNGPEPMRIPTPLTLIPQVG